MKDGIDGVVLSITSSAGNVFHNIQIETTLSVSVFTGTTQITTQEDLETIFGEDAELKWYDILDSNVGTGFSLEVLSIDDIEKYKVRLETA